MWQAVSLGEDRPGVEESGLQRRRCQIYSRVVGFLTPISQWNKGKREEFRDRKTYSGLSEVSAWYGVDKPVSVPGDRGGTVPA